MSVKGKILWPFISEDGLDWNLADHLISTPPPQTLKIKWNEKEIDICIEYKNIQRAVTLISLTLGTA